MNAEQFSASMLEMAAYAEGQVFAVIRKACIDLYRRFVERTPVDTGRAKGSWGITVFESSTAQSHELPDDPEGYSVNEITEIINAQVADFRAEIIEDQVILYNNLEYIDFLEGGSSTQAPAGMVAVSLAEFEAFFNKAITELAGDLL